MPMNVNQDYSQFYVGTEQLKSYGSNSAAKKDMDLCQYFGHKKLKVHADFFNSSSSFCWGVI